MATATFVEATNFGPGPARLYALDPPVMFDGIANAEVIVWIQPQMWHQAPEVGVQAVNVATRTVKRQKGSFVLHDNPDTPELLEGAFAWALLTLGYQVGE